MDFEHEQVRECFADFLNEERQAQSRTIESFAGDAGVSVTQMRGYLNPNSKGAPKKITSTFYNAMLTVLGRTHEDFKNFFQNWKTEKNQTGGDNTNKIYKSKLDRSPVGANVVNYSETHHHAGEKVED